MVAHKEVVKLVEVGRAAGVGTVEEVTGGGAHAAAVASGEPRRAPLEESLGSAKTVASVVEVGKEAASQVAAGTAVASLEGVGGWWAVAVVK